MSIISIISSACKLNYWSDYWCWSCFFSLCPCVSHPRTRITTPSDILVLCYIPSTIPSYKTSWFTSILHSITIFESCFWRNSYFWWFLSDLWILLISIFCSSFCKSGFRTLSITASLIYRRCLTNDGSRNHQIHTNTNTRSITKHIDCNYICRINIIFRSNTWNSITRYNAMHYSRYWRNLEHLTNLKLIFWFEIICPQNCISTHPIFIWNTGNTLTRFDSMFLDCSFSRSWNNWWWWNRIIFTRFSSYTNQSCIRNIPTICHITEVIVGCNNSRFIIVSGTNSPSRSEERERWIYWKYDNKSKSEPLKFSESIRYWWNINIDSSCSCLTSFMIWTYGQSNILGIKVSRRDIPTFYIL